MLNTLAKSKNMILTVHLVGFLKQIYLQLQLMMGIMSKLQRVLKYAGLFT